MIPVGSQKADHNFFAALLLCERNEKKMSAADG